MRGPQSVVYSIAGWLHKRFKIACGTSKWNLKGVTVRPCRIWKISTSTA